MTERLEKVHHRITEAAVKSGRHPETIRLVAVSKTVPAERAKEAIEAGVTILGENYVQEARKKFNALSAFPVSWHYIGHLQSNKAKYAVRMFDLIHSVDSVKLANALNKQAQKIDKVQDILVQVNIAGEDSKSGILESEAEIIIRDISRLENLSVKGLMTMPPFFNSPDRVRPYFQALRDLRGQIKNQAMENIHMNELSMGMTGDFEVAIEEGATLVRIGTAIFGERD